MVSTLPDKLYRHPYIFCCIYLLLVYLTYSVLGFLNPFIWSYAVIPDDLVVPKAVMSLVAGMFWPSVFLLVFMLLFRKDIYFLKGKASPFTCAYLCIVCFLFSGASIHLVHFLAEPSKYNITLQTVLHWLSPGIGEKILFRLIPVSVLIYSGVSPGVTAVLTGIMFGSMHLVNVLSGAPVFTTWLQVMMAASSGMLAAAIYMRTGCIWICMLEHSVQDIMVFSSASSIYDVSGVATQEIVKVASNADMWSTLWNYAFTCCVMWIIPAMFILRRKKSLSIRQLWRRRRKVKYKEVMVNGDNNGEAFRLL